MPFLWGTHWVATLQIGLTLLSSGSTLSATDTFLMLPSHLNGIYLRQNFYYPSLLCQLHPSNQEHRCQNSWGALGSIPWLGTKILPNLGVGCSVGSLEEPLLLLPHRSLSEPLSRLRCSDIPSPLLLSILMDTMVDQACSSLFYYTFPSFIKGWLTCITVQRYSLAVWFTFAVKWWPQQG